MGKRSKFERRASDSYETPVSAVKPLLAHLNPGTRFIEPCAGSGKLIKHLTAAGHLLEVSSNLPNDARKMRYDVAPDVVFITNPPYWGWPDYLHPLIENLSNQAPAWLLLPGDWIFNLSSAPLMPRVKTIVAIGRVKWIPNSPYTGKDNCAWILFERPDDKRAIRFVGRRPNGDGASAAG
jgi:hypothetical protein